MRCLPNQSIIGKKFDRLLVVSNAGKNKNGSTLYKCICDCGNTRIASFGDLNNGRVRSCGCLWRDVTVKHGMSRTPIYNVWSGMIKRCTKPYHKSYRLYGGRGIKVCEEWLHDPNSFIEWALSHGYQEGLTLDRIDVNGSYCPLNCRWSTVKQQARNRRTNKTFLYKGSLYCLVELAEETGVPYDLIKNRIRLGWDIKRALEEPLHKEFSNKRI